MRIVIIIMLSVTTTSSAEASKAHYSTVQLCCSNPNLKNQTRLAYPGLAKSLSKLLQLNLSTSFQPPPQNLSGSFTSDAGAILMQLCNDLLIALPYAAASYATEHLAQQQQQHNAGTGG